MTGSSEPRNQEIRMGENEAVEEPSGYPPEKKESAWGLLSKLALIGAIIFLLVTSCAVSNYLFKWYNPGPSLFLRDYYANYNVEITPNSTDRYLVDISFPFGDDNLNGIIRERTHVASGKARLAFVSTENGGALEVNGTGNVTIQAHYWSKHDQKEMTLDFGGMTLINETERNEISHSPVNALIPVECTLYFSSSSQNSPSISWNFTVGWGGGPVGGYSTAQFQSGQVVNGWNPINGTYQRFSSTA